MSCKLNSYAFKSSNLFSPILVAFISTATTIIAAAAAAQARAKAKTKAFRINNLIGKEFPCHGKRCRFESDLVRY